MTNRIQTNLVYPCHPLNHHKCRYILRVDYHDPKPGKMLFSSLHLLPMVSSFSFCFHLLLAPSTLSLSLFHFSTLTSTTRYSSCGNKMFLFCVQVSIHCLMYVRVRFGSSICDDTHTSLQYLTPPQGAEKRERHKGRKN